MKQNVLKCTSHVTKTLYLFISKPEIDHTVHILKFASIAPLKCPFLLICLNNGNSSFLGTYEF